jgi:hypothetical protein
LPREVYDALKSDQLKHLKISEDAFNCFFGLWYRVNVVPEKYLAENLPYPKTARIIPISVSKWNTLKGGGDAITKLIDSCRERIGIRGEGTVACARILMYYAVLFHRFNCMLSAGKKLREYASITHWRNAASHRFTFADSIDLFIDLILKHAGIGSGADDDDGRAIDLSGLQDDVPSGVFAPSPSGAVTTVDQSNALCYSEVEYNSRTGTGCLCAQSMV